MINALRIAGLAPIAVVLMSVVACAGDDTTKEKPAATAKIEGAVVYLERMALPPGAEVEVVLEDVSRPDAPATILATFTLKAEKGPPYPFSIDYDSGQIDPRMTYALRATISVDGKMMFATMDYTAPFSGNPVEVLVKRVPGD